MMMLVVVDGGVVGPRSLEKEDYIRQVEDSFRSLAIDVLIPLTPLSPPEPSHKQSVVDYTHTHMMFDLSAWDHRTRIRVFSVLGGMLFSLSWWFMIVAAVYVDHENDPLKLKAPFWLPGVGASIMFFIVSLMDWSALYADELTHYRARETRMGAIAMLSFAILIGLASLIGSIYILAKVYAGEQGYEGNKPASTFPGQAIFAQTFLLFIGSFVARLGRLELDESGAGGY